MKNKSESLNFKSEKKVYCWNVWLWLEIEGLNMYKLLLTFVLFQTTPNSSLPAALLIFLDHMIHLYLNCKIFSNIKLHLNKKSWDCYLYIYMYQILKQAAWMSDHLDSRQVDTYNYNIIISLEKNVRCQRYCFTLNQLYFSSI